MGYAYIVAAALLWATIGPAARFALRAGVEPLEISFLAYAVWGEALRARGYVGAALVLAGVLLVATERDARMAVDPPHEGPAPVS